MAANWKFSGAKDMMVVMDDVTRILADIESGDQQASTKLLPLVYDELRKLAAVRLANEKPGQTLQATALVHEAYLRLVGNQQTPSWNSQGHFFGAAAEAMRRIMVEQARKKQRVRHGGDLKRRELDDGAAVVEPLPDDLLALDEALERLEQEHASRAQIVKLRYFAGLTMPQAAKAMGISLSTAERYWTFARTWLYAEVSDTSALSKKKNDFR